MTTNSKQSLNASKKSFPTKSDSWRIVTQGDVERQNENNQIILDCIFRYSNASNPFSMHLSTDAGKELTEKIGLVYQINVAPKKLGFEEVTCFVDLKKGEVTKG
ncbi:hypothetical protein YC2023_038001 [Brassica napus]